MLKLYCAPRTISVAVVTLLNESGVHWEPIRVDLAGGEQTRAPYRALNPKGRVPVLMTPEGPLTETGAILEYLAETATPGFVPADPLARARMREVMFYLASTMHVNHAHRLRGARWADDPAAHQAMTAKVPQTMTASAAYVEDLMTGPFLFGADLTLADFYLFAVCLWLDGDGVDVAAFPRIEAFMAAMEATKGVRKTRGDGLIA
ncbi:MAG: glutathione S-transferase family protein [Rhodobacteraceae bacterium]|nr:MAG: glutathione S-transferase family protein [Paracoccaceae bacterium]